MEKSTQAIAFCFLLASLNIHAKSSVIEKSGNSFDLSIDTRYGYINNYLLEPTSKQSNQYWQISPDLQFQMQTKQHQLSLESNVQHLSYQQYTQDDHTNITISPHYQYKWAVNQGIYFNTSWQKIFEQRGTGLSIGDAKRLKKLDEKHSQRAVIGYRYGSDDSIAKLSFELGYSGQKYQTRRKEAKVLDYNSTFGRVSFDYLYGNTTYFATELSHEQLQFKYQPFYDKDKSTALVGVKWSLSPINQFDLLLGYQDVSFDEPLFADDRSAKWRVSWRWLPQPSMSLSFTSSRDFAEANRLVNSYRLVDNHQLTISKKLNERFQVDSNVGFTQQDVIFEENQTSESYMKADIKIGYQWTRRAQFYLSLRYQDLSASEEYLEHQRTQVALGVKVNL